MLHTSLQNILYLKGLQLAHSVTDNDNLEISILIGADYYWSFVEDHVICGSGPTTVQSKLGYLLSGPLSTQYHNSSVSLFHISIQSAREASDIEKFWNVEAAGTAAITTKDDPDKEFLRPYMKSSISCQPV